MLDLAKQFRTRDGRRVIDLRYEPYNSAGHKVTYPIKGNIVTREKPLKCEYHIWSEDGIFDVVFRRHSEKDLVTFD